MKDLGKVVLICWAILATLLSSWLLTELSEARARVREEVELKLELSATVDSLLWEADFFKSYIKDTTGY